jgi:transposase
MPRAALAGGCVKKPYRDYGVCIHAEGCAITRFIQGIAGHRLHCCQLLDDYVGEDNPVRIVDAFVEQLDLRELGFAGIEPKATGRPSYHPAILLKLYIYGYLNRIQSSRRLERESQRNIELM